MASDAGAVENHVFDIFVVVAVQVDGMEFHVEKAEKNPFRNHHQRDKGPEENQPFQIAPEEDIIQRDIENRGREDMSENQGTYQSHIIPRGGPEPKAAIDAHTHKTDKNKKRNNKIQGCMAHHAGTEDKSLFDDINPVYPPVSHKEDNQIKNGM